MAPQIPFETILSLMQRKYAQDQAQREAPGNNIVGALQNLASGYANNKAQDTRRREELEGKARLTELSGYFDGKGGYIAPDIVPTSNMIAQDEGKTYQGKSVATGVPEMAVGVAPNYPSAMDILSGKGGTYIPKSKNFGTRYEWDEGQKKYVDTGVSTGTEANSFADMSKVDKPESPFAGLQKQRIMDNFIKSYNNDAVVKGSRSAIASLDMIEEAANSNNPIAHNSLATLLARGYGREVGMLSEGDKKPFGGSQALEQRIKKVIEEAKTGLLNEDNRKFVLQLTDVARRKNREIMQGTAKTRSKQYSKVNGFGTEKDLYSILEPEMMSTGVPEPSPDNLQEGDAYMGGKFMGWEE